MNYLMVLKNLGILLVCEAISMVPSLIVALIYGESSAWAFLYTISLLLIIAAASSFIKPKNRGIYVKDGFAIVAIGWILISFFGALPFYFSGAIPSLVDSFFEASSGFSTTGASILQKVEGLPQAILFWRSFTHWVGGMGVLILAMAILPSVGTGSVQIMKAESPGPNPGKLVPKVRQTAKILYAIYIVITVVLAILLKIAGMSWFDSLIHTFGTVGTGGFSNMDLSVGAYNNVYIDVIITVFMFICGANFALHYQVIKGNFKGMFKDGEFKLYALVVLASILLVAVNIHGTMYSGVLQSLRHSAFQVVTVITTTGYATTDFNLWPVFSKTILVFLMFIGGCAGSTAGGIKNIRFLILFKAAKRDLFKIIHPRAIYSVKVDGKTINDQTLSEVLGFFFMYIMVFCGAMLIISIEGKDLVSTFTAVATTLGNVGPGLGIVGPRGNFSSFSDLSTMVFSFCMIVGRLEIYPILLLTLPSFWKR